MRPHGRQPTRLPRPWDSPGKNTGVGCHFLLQCMKVKGESEVAQACLTLRDPMDCSPPGSSVHGIFQAGVLEWGAIAFSDSHHYRSAKLNLQAMLKINKWNLKTFIATNISTPSGLFAHFFEGAVLLSVSHGYSEPSLNVWSTLRSSGTKRALWIFHLNSTDILQCLLH